VPLARAICGVAGAVTNRGHLDTRPVHRLAIISREIGA
jgi:hypothetical protein